MNLFVERSFRVPRLWSNNILNELCPIFAGEIINVSGWDDRDKEGDRYKSYFSGATSYYLSNHRGERGLADADGLTDYEIDLETPLSSNLVGRFDVVFNHTTLEHIFDIQVAFSTLCQMSRDIVIVIVPFAQKVHYTSSYGDYWRFTPMGLRRLFQVNGLEVIFEAANSDTNAGIYVISVGSYHPERWRHKMPKYIEVNSLGGWIGRNPYRKIVNGFAKLLKVVRLIL